MQPALVHELNNLLNPQNSLLQLYRNPCGYGLHSGLRNHSKSNIRGITILHPVLKDFSTQPLEIYDLYLEEPDSGGTNSDDHYKITVKIHKTDAQNIDIVAAAISECCDAAWPDGTPDSFVSPLIDGANFVDNNPDLASYIVVTFKSLVEPTLTPSDASFTIGDLARIQAKCAFDGSNNLILQLLQVTKCYPISDGKNEAIKLLGADQQALLEAYYAAPENIRSAIRTMLNLVE